MTFLLIGVCFLLCSILIALVIGIKLLSRTKQELIAMSTTIEEMNFTKADDCVLAGNYTGDPEIIYVLW
jgi:hypothetical protein